MDWRTADTSVAVAVPFLADGEFIIPAAGSLTLTIRDNTGTVLSGYDEAALSDETGSTMLLTIPAEVNGVQAGSLESRYVRVSYRYGDVPLAFDYSYRLAPFLPISATPSNVRSLIGIDSKALPDTDLDLYEAYFKLKADVGANFVAALISGTRAAISANNMIALQAAITVLPSLQNRVMKSETSHNEIYIRNILDLEKLDSDLDNRLVQETNDMQNEMGGTTTDSTITPIFFLTSPTDVITGA